jgi:hypothetical protein
LEDEGPSLKCFSYSNILLTDAISELFGGKRSLSESEVKGRMIKLRNETRLQFPGYNNR